MESSCSVRDDKASRMNKSKAIKQNLDKTNFIKQCPKIHAISNSCQGLHNSIIPPTDYHKIDKPNCKASYKKIKNVLNEILSELKGMSHNELLDLVGGIMFVIGGIR